MDYLTDLPHEVLHNILKCVDPINLVSISCCCRSLYRFILGNRALFRDLYLQNLDEPTEKPNCAEYDWEDEIHKFVKLQRILASRCVEQKTPHTKFVAEMVSNYMQNASPKKRSLNINLLTRLFDDRTNQETFFCQSTIFERARMDRTPHGSTVTIPFDERQMSAKAHTLYGVPIEYPRRTKFNNSYPYACSVVYDLRNYTEENMWGPFLGDGKASVDWERMEAIMIVLGYNLRMFTDNTHGVFKPLWIVPWTGASPNSFSPISLNRLPQPAPPKNALDPYNVSGTWMRVVCFLDFSELFAYNFNSIPTPHGQPRRPLETTEAIRLIVMEINVDNITEPEENDGKDLPVVHFSGTSRSMHTSWDPNANANIRGTVRMTLEGEVRWTTYSIYGGAERWKSEGIQVGGVGSSRGVLGHWFDKDFDVHGPAGPTAFWKISNEIDSNELMDDGEDEEGEDEEGEDN